MNNRRAFKKWAKKIKGRLRSHIPKNIPVDYIVWLTENKTIQEKFLETQLINLLNSGLSGEWVKIKVENLDYRLTQ